MRDYNINRHCYLVGFCA